MLRGQSRWYHVSVRPLYDEQAHATYVLINATDIHALKTTQHELLSLTSSLEERVRARVIPAPVKQLVKKVAKRALSDLQKTDSEIERELRIELAQQQIAYDRAYARALEQERERQVTAEIRRLLALQAQQQETKRIAAIAAQLAELKRQIDEFKRRDEQEIELLLMYS
jgi:hypothetical protein